MSLSENCSQFFYSPFDALGISLHDLSSVQTSSVIKRWKQLGLMRHPDKIAKTDSRWPTQTHLNVSKDFLVGLIEDETLQNLLQAARYFQYFPVSFQGLDSTRLIYPWKVQDPQLGLFSTCRQCHMVLRSTRVDAHFDEHNTCSVCDCELTAEDREEHYLERHHLVRCDCCGKRITREELSNHTITHTCPVCCEDSSDPIPDVWHHLELEHGLNPCDECGGEKVGCHVYVHHHLKRSTQDPSPCSLCDIWCSDLDDHLETYHYYCKCPACELLLDPSCLWEHVWCLHELQRCESTCTGGTEHLTSEHRWQPCREDNCSQLLDSRSLNNHLVQVHQWKKCHCCDHIESMQALLTEHLVWEHHLQECPECDQATLNLAQHFETEHNYQKCPFCGRWASLDFLRGHIGECSKTLPCSDCHELQTPSSYGQHRIDKHGWVDYGYCDHLEQNGQLLDLHVQQNHNPQPCPDCGAVLATHMVDTHRIELHGYQQCPFCPILSCQLLEHILTAHHLADDEQPFENRSNDTIITTESDSWAKDKIESLAQGLTAIVESNDIPGSQYAISTADRVLGRAGGISDTVSSQSTPDRSSSAIHASPCRQPATARDCEQSSRPGPGSHDISREVFGTLPTPVRRKRAVSPGSETTIKRHQPNRSGKGGVTYAIPSSRKPPRGSSWRTGAQSSQNPLVPPRVATSCDAESLVRELTCMETLVSCVRLVLELKQDTTWKQVFQIDEESKIVQLMSISNKFEDRKKGAKLIKEFSLMLLAEAIDSSKRTRDRKRADEYDQRDVLTQHSYDSDEKQRIKLKNQLQRGRQLVKLCGHFRGLLCFLALNKMGKFLQLTKQGREEELQRFHECLKEHERQWIAGAGVLESIEKRSFDAYVVEQTVVQELTEGKTIGHVLNTLLPNGEGKEKG